MASFFPPSSLFPSLWEMGEKNAACTWDPFLRTYFDDRRLIGRTNACHAFYVASLAAPITSNYEQVTQSCGWTIWNVDIHIHKKRPTDGLDQRFFDLVAISRNLCALKLSCIITLSNKPENFNCIMSTILFKNLHKTVSLIGNSQ